MGVDAYLLCVWYIDFTHERGPGLSFGIGVGIGIRVMRRLLADAPAKVAVGAEALAAGHEINGFAMLGRAWGVGAGASQDVVPRVVGDRGGDDVRVHGLHHLHPLLVGIELGFSDVGAGGARGVVG